MRTLILLITIFLGCAFCAQTNDEFFIGEWKAWQNPATKTEFQYLDLEKSGTSYYGPGVTVNGNDKLVPNLVTNINKWTVKNDTIFLISEPLPIDNKGNTKSMTIMFVIKEKGNDYFIAYYSDPEIDKMMESSKEKSAPTLLRFEKLKH